MSDEEYHNQQATNDKRNDGEKNSLSDSFEEDDIDREIEKEINSMDSTLSPKEMNRIKALNEARVTDSNLKVTVDWSDVSNGQTGKDKLRCVKERGFETEAVY